MLRRQASIDSRCQILEPTVSTAIVRAMALKELNHIPTRYAIKGKPPRRAGSVGVVLTKARILFQ